VVGAWNLEFGIFLVFGFWCLGFVCRLGLGAWRFPIPVSASDVFFQPPQPKSSQAKANQGSRLLQWIIDDTAGQIR